MRSAQKGRNHRRNSHQATTTRTRSKKPSANGQMVRFEIALVAVAIGDAQFALGADRLADDRQFGIAGGGRARTDQQARSIDIGLQVRRQHGGDLGERAARRSATPRRPGSATQREPSTSASISSSKTSAAAA